MDFEKFRIFIDFEKNLEFYFGSALKKFFFFKKT